jgi:hypothetical protein
VRLTDGLGDAVGRRPVHAVETFGAALLILAGTTMLMAIVTGEALFRAAYTTSQNTIRDLGSTWQPGAIVRESSATIFTAMLISGLMIVAAAAAYGGLSGVLTYRVTTAPFRYVSVTLGLISLGSLVLSGPLAAGDLGADGVERWVAYPVVLWVVAFGGYLLGAGPEARVRLAGQRPSRHGQRPSRQTSAR